MTTFESGTPYTVFNGFDADGIAGNNDRPTYNPAGLAGVRAVPVVNSTTGAITHYINPEADNAIIDPKNTRIRENMRLGARAEFFNVWNHPQFLDISTSNAGTGTDGRFLKFDTVGTSGGGRTIRYQLKFVF